LNPLLTIIALLGGAIACAQPGPGGSGDGVWTRNAAFGELETFDLCNGHQPGSGMYHHHVNPICLRAQLNDNVVIISTGRLGTQYAEKATAWTHSPILGWAFDGYPVYGPYGYSDPKDPKSAIKRLTTGFRLRDITQRHSLPDWVLPYEPTFPQTLTATQYGPDVSSKFPLGRYVQDYEYVAGLGDLDQYNGRFTVTPEYPNGTYAYFVTVASDGSPAFPYIINVQLYGVTGGGGNAPAVSSDAADYFANGALTQPASSDPQLATWYTKGSAQNALAITGFDPSTGPSTTWPTNAPSGVTVMGGNRTPALADVQRVRYNTGTVYVNSNNLPSYTIGPWFEATMTGGVFMNWPSASSQQMKVPRSPAPANTKSASGMGPVGMWVNGVAIFNVLDGASYSNARADDAGGGGVSPRATHLSAASLERGPLAQGSIVTAFPEFNATLATSTEGAATAVWPMTLGGATVTVTDSAGVTLPAGILYASPTQVNYQLPAISATGLGRVTITAGGTAVSGTVNIVATYPGLFNAAQILTIDGNSYLILYGTGIGTSAATATIGGVNATVLYSGPQGTYPGLDQVNLLIPSGRAGKSRVDVILTAAGKPSSPISVVLP
jgi:uncharacterized protein (TIGR03437 family)